jgi:predicted ATPase
MGGAGKTALGLRLAHELKKEYPDAQIYLDLRGVDTGRKGEKPLEPAEVMNHVIQSFHPEEKAPEEANKLEARYRSVLAKKRALLFYDNARDAQQVQPLVPPEGCLLLVTSRQEFFLPGLEAVVLGMLEREESCKLLLAIEPRIDGFAEEIAELCGDLPQALRSAGCTLNRERTLSVEEYAERLRDKRERLRQLKPAGNPELNVEVSLEVSYELLDSEQQRLFRGLAVFAGPFRAVAAAEVWDTGLEQARKQLEEFRRRNLVEFSEESERFRLHDLVKVFTGGKIQEDERGRFGRRHAEHYCKVLAFANELFRKGGEGVRLGLRLFDAERENIEAGWERAAENIAVSREALELCSRYPDVGVYVLSLRLHSRRWIEWLTKGLEAAEKLGDKRAIGRHLGNLGLAYAALGEVRKAIGSYEQHLAIVREIGDRQGEGAALGNLGIAYARLGERGKAVEYTKEALRIFEEIESPEAEKMRRQLEEL